MKDIQIIKEFKRRVQVIYPEADVYFYGSRVTGQHREDSDYDVLVLLNSVTPIKRDIIYDIAWETGFEFDIFISPVLADKKEFTNRSSSPFFINVRQHGLAL